jgi:hypothetical protein
VQHLSSKKVVVTKKAPAMQGLFCWPMVYMLEKIFTVLSLIVLLVLLYGAGLIVADRERACAERQALRKRSTTTSAQSHKE